MVCRKEGLDLMPKKKTKKKLTAIELAHLKRREMKEAGIEIKRKTPIEKLAENPTSLRKAVNAKCYDCQGSDGDPKVRSRIGKCHCVSCPLYNVRPYQKKVDEDDG